MSAKLMRVLLVDDEYYFRQLLIHLIDWTALGYVIAQEAENGTQALEYASKETYDLIIADINMPGMTGLEFVKALRASSISANVIYITSYDSFDYARTAIQLGASHYLLKPVDEEELIQALRDLREEWIRRSELTRTMEDLKQQVERTKPVLKDQFIRSLLFYDSTSNSESLEPQAEYYGITPDLGAYAVLIAEIDELNVTFPREHEKQLWRFTVKNVLEETFGASDAHASSQAIDGEHQQIVLLIGSNQLHEPKWIETMCEQARRFIHQRINLRVTMAYGQTYEQLSQARLSYMEAFDALKHKFIHGGNQVISYAHHSTNKPDMTFTLPLERNEWLTAIRQRNQAAIHQKIHEVCHQLAHHRARREAALYVLLEYISLGNSILLERGETLPDGWMTDSHPLFAQWLEAETISSMECWLKMFFDEMVLTGLEAAEARTRYSDIVHKALTYIEMHYEEESVTLQQTAREICVNPSYLSHIFKKDTGKSFTEYLTDVRLKKAMELLAEPSTQGEAAHKVTEVSQKVGYADPYYFTRCFKKKYGFVPSKVGGTI